MTPLVVFAPVADVKYRSAISRGGLGNGICSPPKMLTAVGTEGGYPAARALHGQVPGRRIGLKRRPNGVPVAQYSVSVPSNSSLIECRFAVVPGSLLQTQAFFTAIQAARATGESGSATASVAGLVPC